MKSTVSLAIGVLIFILTVETVQSIESRSVREEELRQSVTSAVYTALEFAVTDREFIENDGMPTTKDKLNQKMVECFLNALKVLKRSDSKIKVNIIAADFEKGILAVDTSSEFTYSNGKTGRITYKKTGILTGY